MVFITIISLGCQHDIDYSFSNPAGGNQNSSMPFKGSLHGVVLDENEKPAVNAVVHAGGETVMTDTRGYFRINNASLTKNASTVTAEKSGYFKAYRVFGATSGLNQVVIKLIPKTLVGKISAATGGTVTLSNGAKVSLSANGVVKATGSQAYSGDINVYSQYIDPAAADISSIIPGSLLARDKDDRQVLLKSYGMIAVELESTSGEKLQIASGKNAVLTMPIPASLQSTAPSTIALWYVDEQTGIWKEEGSATKNGNIYSGEVKHFSYWNCDVSAGPTVSITGKFLLPNGSPLINGHISIRLSNEGASTIHGFTDSLGQFGGPVPANMALTISVLDPCNSPVYSNNIGPFTTATGLGSITLPSSMSSALVTIKGKLTDCNNAALTNGTAITFYDNIPRYTKAGANGEFTLNFIKCQSSSGSISVIGVDGTNGVQSALNTFNITTPETNVGTISACGVSAEEFIKYTLDGVAYQITSAQTDSLYAYAQGSGNQITLAMFGGNTSSNYIDFRFTCNGATGTFPMTSLMVHQQGVTLEQPANVIISTYPQNIGLFYEGNFSAQFKYTQSPTVTHTISGQYRLRRNQ